MSRETWESPEVSWKRLKHLLGHRGSKRVFNQKCVKIIALLLIHMKKVTVSVGTGGGRSVACPVPGSNTYIDRWQRHFEAEIKPLRYCRLPGMYYVCSLSTAVVVRLRLLIGRVLLQDTNNSTRKCRADTSSWQGICHNLTAPPRNNMGAR